MLRSKHLAALQSEAHPRPMHPATFYLRWGQEWHWFYYKLMSTKGILLLSNLGKKCDTHPAFTVVKIVQVGDKRDRINVKVRSEFKWLFSPVQIRGVVYYHWWYIIEYSTLVRGILVALSWLYLWCQWLPAVVASGLYPAFGLLWTISKGVCNTLGHSHITYLPMMPPTPLSP